MKQFLLSMVALFLGAALAAQTIVDTLPQNKNVILEDFTGIYCTFCPQGHTIANDLKTANPGRVVVINVHEGGFAAPSGNDPDFRTNFGTAIAGQTNLEGYPAGTVNRQFFQGLSQSTSNPGTAMGRGNWANATNQALAQPSPVNVAATASFDVTTSEMTVYVELYYTADSPAATNRLNVAILQDNVRGPQTGGNQGSNYNHQHILRHLITGQWGEVIDTTTAGHFESRTITYTVPAAYRNVPVQPSDIKIAVFVAEGQQNISTGVEVVPEFIVANAVDAFALSGSTATLQCGVAEVGPSVTIRNNGNEPLTSLTINYSINGGEENTYEWTGSLATLASATVALPAVPYTAVTEGSNEVVFTVSNPNGQEDENEADNATSTTFENLAHFPTQEVKLTLRTDNYGYEVYWDIRDEDNTVLASGGNQTVGANGGGQRTAAAGNPGAYGNNATINQTITLPAEGCFKFRILDDYSDGICCQYGSGYFRLADTDNNILISGAEFGQTDIRDFSADFVVSTRTLEQVQDIKLFPNPASDVLNVVFDLSESTLLDITVTNALGQVIRTIPATQYGAGMNTLNVDVTTLPAGIYNVQLRSSNAQMTHKFIVK